MLLAEPDDRMSSRSTSPDPITYSVGSITGRSASVLRQSPRRALAKRASDVAHSPSKSFIMDTGRAGDVSPWRIKVTVQAEPQEDSTPAKRRTQTTKVPLKGMSSSPARRRGAAKTLLTSGATEENEGSKRPVKKRRGTPIARNIRRLEEDVEATPIHNDSAPPPQHRTSSPRKSRVGATQGDATSRVPTERTKRLRRAREELDGAIEDAVGYSDAADNGRIISEPGDMTMANEDFTMVSMETLQTMKNNTSLIESSIHDHGGKSTLSVSYMPSSPPQAGNTRPDEDADQAKYPNISDQAREARDTPLADLNYDAMSWKATGPAKLASPSAQATQESSVLRDDEPSEWQREREAVSRQIQNANTSQVIVIGDDTEMASHQEADQDIWAEEASRSLEEDFKAQVTESASRSVQASETQQHRTVSLFGGLFGNQPMKPPRSKIPRTWRRTSAADFTYSDSPEHAAPVTRNAPNNTAASVSNRQSAGGTRSRSSGVLTPPSTDDDGTNAGQLNAQDAVQPPEPPALPSVTAQNSVFRSATAEDETEAFNSHSESPLSPDGDDTGLFWQMNLPNVYPKSRPKPQGKGSVELSDLLASNERSSPEKVPVIVRAQLTSAPRESSANNNTDTLRGHPRVRRVMPPRPKLVNSPLRQSLLRSSKIGGGLLTGTPMQLHAQFPKARQTHYRNDFSSFVEHTHTELGESFESKASDQRQLLGELAAAPSKGHSRDQVFEESILTHTDESELSEDSNDNGDEELHSYEERLNLDSPQRIKVNFNESQGNSSLLAAKREYGPLFDLNPNSSSVESETLSLPEMTLIGKKEPADLAQPGIFSRLTNTFWAAVVRPTGPTSVMPNTTAPIAGLTFPPSLRVKLRSRYGVLADTHPWTFAHMRTLHRMLNSSLSKRNDTLIPKYGQLPPYLESLIGTRCTAVTDFDFLFTEPCAHIVHAFMQTLVPVHVITAMQNGEVEVLGDAFAKTIRGVFGNTNGRNDAFDENDMLIHAKHGAAITMDFVARAIGNAVFAHTWESDKQLRAKRNSELDQVKEEDEDDD